METKSYTTINRSGWSSGPWDDEPDKLQWTDQATQLPCLAVRHLQNGHWCGYVGVADEHPLYNKGYDEVAHIEVHGGLTFSDFCQPDENEAESICHIPAPGEPERVWWLGFDCAHSRDGSPKWPEGLYRTLQFVQTECESLAAQLSKES